MKKSREETAKGQFIELQKRGDTLASPVPQYRPLHLDMPTFRILLEKQGPSLGLWRAAEIAVLREQQYDRPILDLGCGDGLVTSLVLSRVEVGLDPDKDALARAAQMGIYERFVAEPAEVAQLPCESVSTVLSNSVLEHLLHLDAVLEAVARVLRPGGQLIFTAPTAGFSQWLVLPIAPYAAWRNRQLQHLNLWTIDCWTEHLAKVGLEVQEVRPYLRPELVRVWDALELLQQIWIGPRRLLSIFWRCIPSKRMDQLAQKMAQLDLAAPLPGGGCLIAARKNKSKTEDARLSC